MTALSTVITSVLQGRHSFPVIPFDFRSCAVRASSPLHAHPQAVLGEEGSHPTPSSYLSSLLFLCLPFCVLQITNSAFAHILPLHFEMKGCSAKRGKISERRRIFISAIQLMKWYVSCTRLGEEIPCRCVCVCMYVFICLCMLRQITGLLHFVAFSSTLACPHDGLQMSRGSH